MQVSFQVQQAGHCELQFTIQVQQQPKQAPNHIDREAVSVKLNLTYLVSCTEHTSTDAQSSRLADITVSLATPAAPAAPAVPASPVIAQPVPATESSSTVPVKFPADDCAKRLKKIPSGPPYSWVATCPEAQPFEARSSTPPGSPLKPSTIETAASTETTSYSLGSPDRYSGDDLDESLLMSSVERAANDLIKPVQTPVFPSLFGPAPFAPWAAPGHLPGSLPRFPIEYMKQSSNCSDSYPELRSIETSPFNSPQAPIKPSEPGLFARPKLSRYRRERYAM